MSVRITVIPCIAAVWYLSACDGSPTGPAVPASEAEIVAVLTGSQWMRAGLSITPGFDINADGRVITDLFAEEPACAHDDVFTMKADGTWMNDEGPTKCDVDAPQVGTGTWTLNATHDSLYTDDDSDPDPQVAKIAVLNPSGLSLVAVSTDWPDGQARTQTFTWRAK